MSSLFKSILIPVDFSDNTKVAVNQVIELAYADGSTIHLLHIIRPKALWSGVPVANQSISPVRENYHAKKEMSKLLELKYAIEGFVSYCKVHTYVAEGTIHGSIQDAVKKIKPELIIFGKNSNHKYFSLFNPVCSNALAKSAGCPVLTVIRRAIIAKINIIVVPVDSFIPTRKIEFVIELAKKYRAAIHLVTIQNKIDFEETKENSFLDTYRILKIGHTTPIEHHILKGNNLPKAILEYAGSIRADLIHVNHGSETRISNLTVKHMNDAVTASSKLKILSVEPYHEKELSIG